VRALRKDPPPAPAQERRAQNEVGIGIAEAAAPLRETAFKLLTVKKPCFSQRRKGAKFAKKNAWQDCYLLFVMDETCLIIDNFLCKREAPNKFLCCRKHQSCCHFRNNIYKDKVFGRIEVVLTCLINDPEVITSCRRFVRQDLVNDSDLQIVLIPVIV
ncbi:MAG: hypothetical protein ACREBD_34180, partial [Blastocatellia bacterium]